MFFLFVLMAIAGALLRPLVGVNYDMKDYLPEDTPSTKALVVMNEEFGGSMPNARVMIKGVTYKEALAYKAKIEAVDGVEQVTWLDDSLLLEGMPASFLDDATVRATYVMDENGKTGSALMTVTINKDKRQSAVSDIRSIVGDDNCMTGDAVSTAVATDQTVVEIMKVAVTSVLLVIIILILTTMSWLDPLIILAGIGVAILINNGTNLIFGEISFVTNASGSILQLAVSLDYSVFLIHRFEECRKELTAGAANPAGAADPAGANAPGVQDGAANPAGANAPGVQDGAANPAGAKSGISSAEAAMVEALCKCTGSIASSGLTTVIGFIVLVLMRYQIGPDMGLALAKGVVISLITVFTFTPSMMLIMTGLTDRTRHKKLLPDFAAFGRLVKKLMIPAVLVFVIVIVPAFMLSTQNNFYFGASHIFGPGTQVGDDREEINEIFGNSDTYAVMVPKNDPASEKKLVKLLREYPEIKGIRAYGSIFGTIPGEIIPGGLSGLLQSEKYSRLVLTVDAEYEGEKTFNLVKSLRKTCESVYGDNYYLAGEGVSTYDLMDTITADMLKINLAAVLAIYVILVLMFRKLFLPALLVASIETAIWVNVAIPNFMHESVFYISYLIISSVQLGATVDYAILLTDRYRENRLTMKKQDAVVETIRNVTASICTSGSALVIVGFLMGFLSTHGILAQLGIFIGRGAVCSLIIVLFVLPGLLYLFDRFATRSLPSSRSSSC